MFYAATRRSRGKDMSNIIGVCESSNDKPPASKRKKRYLTKLDTDDEDQEEDSEEFQLSELVFDQVCSLSVVIF